mmetsp:Transcript_36677/g.109070  ORF Transcript_36677/g.109070 Transcript_36677/m.109070 type:complete len:279 (-) Transcript_36677:32-868(-)
MGHGAALALLLPPPAECRIPWRCRRCLLVTVPQRCVAEARQRRRKPSRSGSHHGWAGHLGQQLLRRLYRLTRCAQRGQDPLALSLALLYLLLLLPRLQREHRVQLLHLGSLLRLKHFLPRRRRLGRVELRAKLLSPLARCLSQRPRRLLLLVHLERRRYGGGDLWRWLCPPGLLGRGQRFRRQLSRSVVRRTRGWPFAGLRRWAGRVAGRTSVLIGRRKTSPLGPLAQPVSLELGAKRVEMLLVLPSESDLPLLLLGTKVGEHCSGVAGQQGRRSYPP